MKRATTTILVSALALAGCGGSGLKSAADDLVRGTSLEIKSVAKTGDNAGTAIAEDSDGNKVTIDLVKKSGEFVFDRCQDVIDTQYDCRDVLKP